MLTLVALRVPQGMMTKAGYSDIAAHKALHAEFVGKLKGLSAPVSGDSIHYAKEWSVFSIVIFTRCLHGDNS